MRKATWLVNGSCCVLLLGLVHACSGDNRVTDGDADTDADADVDPGCAATGETCVAGGDCCSDLCLEGYCGQPEGGTCTDLGQACAAASECCSGRCAPRPDGELVCMTNGCAPTGAACAMATDCCSLSCSGGVCSEEGLCAMETEACTDDSDCCSNSCEAGTCASAGSSCVPTGEACGSSASCCSGSCQVVAEVSRCTMVSVCRGGGELCSVGEDCCSMVCGADGLCPVLDECQTSGEPCTGNRECCSGICSDPGTGVKVCITVTGCRPVGEVCLTSADCCSADCQAYLETGVNTCEHPREPGCLHAGEVCWMGSAANCCPQGAGGGQDLCLPTDLGVTRCYGEGTSEVCVEDGQACSFADECCSGLCLPSPSGDLVCGASSSDPGDDPCVPLAGACTADADCCDLLVCTGGTCRPSPFDCIAYGQECTSSAECCSGLCDPVLGLCLVPIG